MKIQHNTVTVFTNTEGKQALLPKVPANVERNILFALPKKASADLGKTSNSLLFGFNEDANDVGYCSDIALQGLTTPEKGSSISSYNSLAGSQIGQSAQVFGCKFGDTSIIGTLDIDVFYYDTPV